MLAEPQASDRRLRQQAGQLQRFQSLAVAAIVDELRGFADELRATRAAGWSTA